MKINRSFSLLINLNKLGLILLISIFSYKGFGKEISKNKILEFPKTKNKTFNSTSIGNRAAKNEVEKNLIKRILSSCIREKLLPFSFNGDELKIKLSKINSKIIINKVRLHELGNIKLEGNVLLYQKEEINSLDSVSKLLEILTIELDSFTTNSGYNKFVNEIFNCLENAILTSKQVNKINRKLAKEIQNSIHKNFIKLISEKFDVHEQIKFFERWSTDGHPFHPCYKTKLGLSKNQYKKFSSEFENDIHLPILAVDKSLMHKEELSGMNDYSSWFSNTFSRQYKLWRKEMKKLSLSAFDYYPIFVHPWQYQNSITKKFNHLIGKGQLILFNKISLNAQSTISFRTFISKEKDSHPHVKLPVAIQATSALRTVSPASVENGPKLSHVLKQVLEKENSFNQRIKVANEICGLHLNEKAELGKHLSIIYRQNPSSLVEPQNIPIVVAALFQKVPGTQTSLLKNIIDNAIGRDDNKFLDYFSNYIDIVINAFLELYLVYGIALEGHQQNTIMVFDRGYNPTYLIVRDLGGVRIDMEVLKSHGFNFRPHPLSMIVTKNHSDLTNIFLHTVLQSHLGNVIALLADEYDQKESKLWQLVKNKLIEKFNSLQFKSEPKRWKAAYLAIFENDFWKVKSLMKMRINDSTNENVYVQWANPFKLKT